jgi:phage tail sheath protein FI
VPERLSPGIYVEEAPRGEQQIAAPPVTLAAFVGRTLRGPVNEPVVVESMDEFHRVFGGPWEESSLGPCLQDYFDNGGRRAIIVRLINGGRRAVLRLPAGAGTLVLEAVSPGAAEWLRASVDFDNIDPKDERSFNLVLQRLRGSGSERVADQEIYARVSVDPSSRRFIADALLESNLMRVRGAIPFQRPDRTVGPGALAPVTWVKIDQPGTDGQTLSEYDVIGSATESSGIFALQKVPGFNLLCIPPPGQDADIGPTVLLAAIRFCRQRRAILMLDPPRECESAEQVAAYLERLNLSSDSAMMTFPRLINGSTDAEADLPRASCGAVAGLLARTDHGPDPWTPWRDSPRLLRGNARPVVGLDDTEAEHLNALGVNVLRKVAGGRVALSGERTLAGPECPVPAFRSVRIKRLALMIEEALRHGTRWVVFEVPGAELRARVRAQVEAFLASLADRGAFPTGGGYPPFFVKCDGETNPQGADVRGSLHFLVGFAVGGPGQYLIMRVSQTVEAARVVPLNMDRFRFAGL